MSTCTPTARLNQRGGPFQILLRRDDPKPGLEVLDGKDVKVNDGAVAALINVLFGTGQPATAVVVPGFRVPALGSVGAEVQTTTLA